MRRERFLPSIDPEKAATSGRSSQKKSTAILPGGSRASRDRPSVSSSTALTLTTASSNRPSGANEENITVPHDQLDFPVLPDDTNAPPNSFPTLDPRQYVPSAHLILTRVPNHVQSVDRQSGSPLSLVDRQSTFWSDSSSNTSSSDLVQCYPSTQSSVHSRKASAPLTPGQASLFQALFSLAHPGAEPAKSAQLHPIDINTPSHMLPRPTWSPPSPSTDDEESAGSEEDDSESVRHIMCTSPSVDPNTPDNALPFVLQSCK
jgi:hypothetical protein